MREEIKKKEQRLDKLWAKIVKMRSGYICEFCGKQNNLHSHHFISRRQKSLRWDLENGFCLCSSCHFKIHHDRLFDMDFTEFAKTRRDMKYLRLRKQQLFNKDYEALELYLKGEYNDLKRKHDRRGHPPRVERNTFGFIH